MMMSEVMRNSMLTRPFPPAVADTNSDPNASPPVCGAGSSGVGARPGCSSELPPISLCEHLRAGQRWQGVCDVLCQRAVVDCRLAAPARFATPALEVKPMVHTVAHEAVAHLIDPEKVETFNVLGPTVQFLATLAAENLTSCVMRG